MEKLKTIFFSPQTGGYLFCDYKRFMLTMITEQLTENNYYGPK